jgi:hypothetical protein
MEMMPFSVSQGSAGGSQCVFIFLSAYSPVFAVLYECSLYHIYRAQQLWTLR